MGDMPAAVVCIIPPQGASWGVGQNVASRFYGPPEGGEQTTTPFRGKKQRP